jgi:hypothetical protein
VRLSFAVVLPLFAFVRKIFGCNRLDFLAARADVGIAMIVTICGAGFAVFGNRHQRRYMRVLAKDRTSIASMASSWLIAGSHPKKQI